jgi:hypothetical protein
MRDSSSTSHLVRRFTLWLLGQALPSSSALHAPVRLALVSVVIAAAAGTLLSLGVVAALVGLYIYLVNQGIAPGAAVALAGGVGVLAGLIAYLGAKRLLSQIPDQFDDLQLFRGHAGDFISETVGGLVTSFLDGLSDQAGKAAQRKAEKKSEALEEAIASLTAQIEALEAQLHAPEGDSEVVLTIEGAPRRGRPRKS